MFSHQSPFQAMMVYSIFKGGLVAVTTWAIGATFVQSLVVACVSGLLGMFGMLGAAYIAARYAGRNHDMLIDIKRKVNADRREGDEE